MTSTQEKTNKDNGTGKKSSPIKPPFPAIDYHKRDDWSTQIYDRVHKEIEWEDMLNRLYPYHSDKDLAPAPPTMEKNDDLYCDYLNKVSAKVPRPDASWEIKFIPRGTIRPKHHPTRTRCRPDIVAIRKYGNTKIPSDLLSWSHLEATGESDSGDPKKVADAKAGSYSAYHLQTRPDLVFVVGIFVKVSGFKLFLTDACGVLHTPSIQWNTPEARRLLYAWVWRLYHPHTDPSITIEVTKQHPNSRIKIKKRPTFTVTIGGTVYQDLFVLRAGESIGRRTIILTHESFVGDLIESESDSDSEPKPKPGSRSPKSNNPNPQSSNPSTTIVIKEQYIEVGRRFMEGPILNKIHEGNPFPGIVRCLAYEHVKNGGEIISVEQLDQDGAVITRREKTRVVLEDRGTRLADVQTVREFLKGIYDVLEITRALFTKCKILHRDISPNNVLIRERPEPYQGGEIPDYLKDVCFVDYLLKPSAEEENTDTEYDHRQRLATNVFLIDFDCSEDQDSHRPTLGYPKARTGTLMYMARMVHSGSYPDGKYDLPPMPQMDPRVLVQYTRAHENRLRNFAGNDEESITVPCDSEMEPENFQHLLRYDAESVFWFTLSWCIEAQPAEKSVPEEKIPSDIWSPLVGSAEARDARFIARFPKPSFLHSSYVRLATLLKEMSLYLKGDLDFSTKPERQNPEYTHEALQRVLLNFLVQNDAEEFMDYPKADSPRCAEGVSMPRTSTIPSTQLGVKRPISETGDGSGDHRKTFSKRLRGMPPSTT